MGERIALKRKENKLTQEQLAEIVEVSSQTISNIECGRKDAKTETIAKICVALNTDANYILNGKRSEYQLIGISKKIASLSEEQFRIIENLVDMLRNGK